ncbi:MAG: 8-oxoguanine deaminase [Deinococcales bacterium]
MMIIVKDICLLATPLEEGGWLELPNAALVTQGPQIIFQGSMVAFNLWQQGQDAKFQQDLAQASIINAKNLVILPGFINCHHHLYQTLTRSIGTHQGLKLFDWLKLLYPIWAELTSEAVYTSAKTGLIELLLSGCTTSTDHLYLYPNDSRIDDEIAAAQELGIRFHPTRGSMSLGESQGGLPPDRVCEAEKVILEDCIRVIERYHDAKDFAMLQIGLAPCSPFSVSPDLMRESALLARHYGVKLHTHLAETRDEDDFCLSVFGKRPLDYAESLGWLGEDVWFAHMVHPSDKDISRLAHSHSGVCHCPSSNMILASGIAPVRKMLDHKVKVALGVDGSASNDGNHMLGEVRQSMLLQRVLATADAMSAREALSLATLGGAKVLGRADLGSLEAGKAADIIGFRLDDLYHAGAISDPLAALVTCSPQQVALSIVNGQVLIEEGQFKRDQHLSQLVSKHNSLSLNMLKRAGLA